MREGPDVRPVLILGAGVNGAAVARELVLNCVPVTIVDIADIATGATAKSSRLIHGGLRYLEYADFGLVAESLAERERLLRLAPQFVKPLRLHIPVKRRLGGLVQSAFRFLRLTRLSPVRSLATRLLSGTERGLFAVRLGLWMYDRIARSSLLPAHTVHRTSDAGAPAVDRRRFRWVCSYSDAQMLYPERFVIALLKDAAQIADEQGVTFHILPYHKAEFTGSRAVIRRFTRNGTPVEDRPILDFEPSVIVNATGAWGDYTLDALGADVPRLFGGTKGSHIITRHPGLRAALAGDGVYAESSDGRLVFVLPFGRSTLIGTTDVRFEQSPDRAVATPEELAYLVEMVNAVFADLDFSEKDIDAHYSGVRPLPFVPRGQTASITRDHLIHTTEYRGVPLHTLIGGKLTTWRPFGAEVADRVLGDLGVQRVTCTDERIIPGAAAFPTDTEAWIRRVAAQTGMPTETVDILLGLMGTAAEDVLTSADRPQPPELPNLPIPPAVVRQFIMQEWVTRLEDLVERRLLIAFDSDLTCEMLQGLADCLVDCGKLHARDRDGEIEHCRESLAARYGISIKPCDSR